MYVHTHTHIYVYIYKTYIYILVQIASMSMQMYTHVCVLNPPLTSVDSITWRHYVVANKILLRYSCVVKLSFIANASLIFLVSMDFLQFVIVLRLTSCNMLMFDIKFCT